MIGIQKLDLIDGGFAFINLLEFNTINSRKTVVDKAGNILDYSLIIYNYRNIKEIFEVRQENLQAYEIEIGYKLKEIYKDAE